MWQKRIKANLLKWQDSKYRSFQLKLIPNLQANTIIGVRTPQLKKYAQYLATQKNIQEFLCAVPHQYFEENQLHAFIISLDKNFSHCIEAVSLFLPYINNWATCDQLSPTIFNQYRQELFGYLKQWLHSQHPYTIRFAIKILMQHFLDEDFTLGYPQLVARVNSKEYYVKMMIAWYFATALAKQYQTVLPFLTNHCLCPWTHNKTIQKACESKRLTAKQKIYLRSLRVKLRALP